MIKTTISSTPHEIPSSWNDVTFLKYCDVVMAHDQPFMNRLSVYTGIEVDVLNKLTFPGLQQLIEATAFMDNPDDVMAFAEGYESEINIGHETYGKMETSKQAIQQAKIPLLGAVTMIKEYTGEDISNLPITKTIGQAVFFFDALRKFMEKFVRLNDYEPDPDEMEAGVGELAKFGSFGTATAYARKNNMKRAEDVYELPALEVYNTLLYDYIEWDIQRKTARVRERNRKIADKQNR